MSAPLTFAQALLQAEAAARSTLPVALHERLSAAVALVNAGRVFQDSAGAWQVDSASREGLTYTVNGSCSCDDTQYNKPAYCKHRLAMFLSQRVMTLMAQPPAPVVPQAPPGPEEPVVSPIGTPPLPEPPAGIASQHIVMIQGKPFVKFAGLLQLAHERGLTSLSAEWTYNDADLSLAHAVATFQDGRRFEESGDASPSNVTKKVAPAWRRMSLTRAKARALRDALGCDLVAVEELGGQDGALCE
jgi:hypothetical protein